MAITRVINNYLSVCKYNHQAVIYDTANFCLLEYTSNFLSSRLSVSSLTEIVTMHTVA